MHDEKLYSYNGPMTVFYCSKCGATLTPDLLALSAVPTVPGLEDARPRGARQAPPTVPQGYYAIEAEPWGAPFAVRDRCLGRVHNTIVIHPDDAPALRPLPNWENGTGCCGPNGTEGPNRACVCGARVATLAADCFGPYELHLDPVRTYAFSLESGEG
ncbi:hypothetical protein ACFVOK_22035 [Streptomyces sp. NPDC057798]|uniref:hypothetical protein n=1 Tax=Streptomyces sp. NPDC057798 TaxID=3346252 RepID=UPI0036949D29